MKQVNENKWLRTERRGGGFSLIEILAAMTILLVIMLIIATIFHQASIAWDSGMRRSEGNMMARASIAFMARELFEAVTFKDVMSGETSNIQDKSDDITFFALLNEGTTGYRVLRKIRYYQDADMIKRSTWDVSPGMSPSQYGSYTANTNVTMITNVDNIVFIRSDGLGDPEILPRSLRVLLVLNRTDDVSGVGAKSYGPNRQTGGGKSDDDITTW